VSDGRCW